MANQTHDPAPLIAELLGAITDLGGLEALDDERLEALRTAAATWPPRYLRQLQEAVERALAPNDPAWRAADEIVWEDDDQADNDDWAWVEGRAA